MLSISTQALRRHTSAIMLSWPTHGSHVTSPPFSTLTLGKVMLGAASSAAAKLDKAGSLEHCNKIRGEDVQGIDRVVAGHNTAERSQMSSCLIRKLLADSSTHIPLTCIITRKLCVRDICLYTGHWSEALNAVLKNHALILEPLALPSLLVCG